MGCASIFTLSFLQFCLADCKEISHILVDDVHSLIVVSFMHINCVDGGVWVLPFARSANERGVVCPAHPLQIGGGFISIRNIIRCQQSTNRRQLIQFYGRKNVFSIPEWYYCHSLIPRNLRHVSIAIYRRPLPIVMVFATDAAP